MLYIDENDIIMDLSTRIDRNHFHSHQITNSLLISLPF